MGVKCLILLLLVTLSLGQYAPRAEDNSEYEAWKLKHGKSFSEDDDRYRLFIFSQRLQAVRAHNQIPEKSWKQGLNQFSALTDEEFQQTYLGVLPPRISDIDSVSSQSDGSDEDSSEEPIITEQSVQRGRRRRRRRHRHRDDPSPTPTPTPVPQNLTFIDWAADGKVSAIKHQGQCGSCYAFANVASVETAMLIADPLTAKTLSEQQIVDCTGDFNLGCRGGYIYSTLQWMKTNGLVEDSTYPYTSGTSSVTGACQHATGPNTFSTITSNGHGVAALGAAVLDRPVVVHVNADNWQTYSSGIYDGCNNRRVNHGVLLVGVTAQSNWKIKNSWGVSWGQSGYMVIDQIKNCRMTTVNGYRTTI